VTEATCDMVRDSAAEYALGILPSEDRAGVARHLMKCPDCRREVDQLTVIGDDLLSLVPDAEPPLGFDRRVLSAVGSPSRRRLKTWIAAGAGAAAAAAAIAVVAVPRHSVHHYTTASLVADGRIIGSVRAEGHPPWVWVTVDGAGASGRVTCDLMESNGTVDPMGSFDLVNGSGSWGAPEPAGAGTITAARLVAADGHVVAVANFRA
jgi:hypothetical protein